MTRRTSPHSSMRFEPAQSRPPIFEIGATAALTAILGREAIYTGKVMSWNDLGVQV